MGTEYVDPIALTLERLALEIDKETEGTEIQSPGAKWSALLRGMAAVAESQRENKFPTGPTGPKDLVGGELWQGLAQERMKRRAEREEELEKLEKEQAVSGGMEDLVFRLRHRMGGPLPPGVENIVSGGEQERVEE